MLNIRDVSEEDCRLLWEWANDPEVRGFSFESAPIPWEEHAAWFRRKMADRNCHMYVVSGQDGRPVGQVRFDILGDGSAVVSVSIAGQQRGQGYGQEALRLACARLYEAAGVTRFLAYIKPDNPASIRAFEKAGFVYRGSEQLKGQTAVCMELRWIGGYSVNTIAIIQARVGSTRLPGKVLADLCGRPLLAQVIERAKLIRGLDRVVVATTTAERDRPLLELAGRCGAEAFSGSEEDVLDRYYRAAQSFGAETVVRLTADCPLLDPEVSGRVLARFRQGDVDYASNCRPPTFPNGLETEVFSFAALERAWSEAVLTSEIEHVTPYIWKRPQSFRLANVTSPVDLSALRWTVDEPQDLEFVRAVYGRLHREGAPPFGLAEVLALLEREPGLSNINLGFARNEGYAKSLREDKTLGRRIPG